MLIWQPLKINSVWVRNLGIGECFVNFPQFTPVYLYLLIHLIHLLFNVNNHILNCFIINLLLFHLAQVTQTASVKSSKIQKNIGNWYLT